MRAINHIGIAVKSLDEALTLYRALGLEVSGREEVESQKVKVAMLPVRGSQIELLEPTAPDSPIAVAIEKRGEGLHHICFEVEDIRAAMGQLKEAGFQLLSDEPKAGAHGSQVCFLHPRSGRGVLIELCQPAH
ncbi:MAG TPA: methylmalonyl-CoA epimerase [Thermoanaerobaculaceae bacterium]|nr:methylmalonyl-CoA epimerase [Thermoanaerobaculaceae bacterium]HPS79196.1 methylmalonyl-CoA epimerase [Thermoanaerobaculaceae bacterium]